MVTIYKETQQSIRRPARSYGVIDFVRDELVNSLWVSDLSLTLIRD